MAALGCHVTLTDTAEVLPLLRLNAERNLSPAALQGTQIRCTFSLTPAILKAVAVFVLSEHGCMQHMACKQ